MNIYYLFDTKTKNHVTSHTYYKKLYDKDTCDGSKKRFFLLWLKVMINTLWTPLRIFQCHQKHFKCIYIGIMHVSWKNLRNWTCGTLFILVFVKKYTILVQILPKFGISRVFFHPLKKFNVLESDKILFIYMFYNFPENI